MKKIIPIVLLLSLIMSSCRVEHPEGCCNNYTAVIFDYSDVNGDKVLVVPKITKFIDMVDGGDYAPHNYLRRGGIVILTDQNGKYYKVYSDIASPDCRYNRTFTKLKAIVMLTLLDEYENPVGRVVDTLDVELKYQNIEACHLEAVSLNGVPQWRRDTCQTDESRDLTIVRRVIHKDEIIPITND